MKNIKSEVLIWSRLIGFILIWVGLLVVSGSGLTINIEAIKKLPDVVLIYAVLSFIGIKWAWKIPFLQGWLVPFPNLEGTWPGEVISTWEDPTTNERTRPKRAILVVKQSFESISCVVFTGEADSYSTTSQINEDDDSGILRISYSYISKPKSEVRDRSEIHDGAAILKIVRNNNKPTILEGDYWTSRETTGTLKFTFKQRKRLEGFDEKLFS